MADIIKIQTAGAPGGGSWSAGQLIQDKNGIIWKCTVTGSPGSWIALSGTVGTPAPTDHALDGWAYDPIAADQSAIPTLGQLQLIRVVSTTDKKIRQLFYYIATAGVTPTSNQNQAALLDTSGNRLASAVTIDSQVTATGLQTVTLTGTLPDSFVGDAFYVALLFNASTGPALARATNIGAALTNVGLSAANSRFATSGSALTSIPASVAGIAAGVNAFWAALGN